MKKSLMISAAFLGLLTASVSSYALPVLVCRYQPRPGMTGRAQDLGRSVTGFISSIIQLCGDGESKAQLIATQEENNANTSGSSGSTSGTNTSAGSLSNAIEVDCGSGDSSSASSIGIANPLYSSSSSSSSGTTSGTADTSGIANPLLPSADSTTGSSGESGNSGSASSGSGTTSSGESGNSGTASSGSGTTSSGTQTTGGNTTTTGSSGTNGNSGTASSGSGTTSSGAQTTGGSTTTTGSSGGSGSGTSPSDSTTRSVSTFCRSEFPGSAFNYVNTNLLAKEGNVGYKPLKRALASASETNTLRQNIRKAVLDEFFADTTKSEQATTEYQEKIRGQRNAYVQEAASRHVTMGYRVKGHIQNDLAVISSASLSGDGELGAIAVDSHTLEQMVKMELVDLALQMEMMEADAIQFLMHQPVVLMSETKPTSSN